MKKLLVVSLFGLMMGGCALLPQTAQTPASQQKLADTTLTGKVIVTGGVVALQQGNKSTALDSYSLKLSDYNGQQVSVTGQYSGDTLFVDTIERR